MNIFSHFFNFSNNFSIFFLCKIQLYVRAGLGKFGPTQPLTTNLCPDLLSFFNFLLSLQPLAWRVSCSNQFKQENLRKVKTELQLRQQKQTPIWLSPGKIKKLKSQVPGQLSALFHYPTWQLLKWKLISSGSVGSAMFVYIFVKKTTSKTYKKGVQIKINRILCIKLTIWNFRDIYVNREEVTTNKFRQDLTPCLKKIF